MSQVQSVDSACERLMKGDVSAVCELTDVEISLHGSRLIPILSQVIRSCDSPQIEAKGATILTSIASTTIEVAVFASIGRLFFEKLQHVSCSHDWASGGESTHIARFYASNLLSIVRQQSKCAPAVSLDALNTYLAISRFSLTTLSPAASLSLHQCVMQRLDHLLSIIFKSGERNFQMKWLLTLSEKAASPESSIAVFHAMCGMLRGVHVCKTADFFELLKGMLLWLPGMEECLKPSTPLARLVSLFANKIPEAFWATSDASDAMDQPPWLKWWQVSFRTAYFQPLTTELMGLMVASFQVKPLASLERVIALWRSLFYLAPNDKRSAFRSEVHQWLQLLDDDDLCASLSITFEMPLQPQVSSTSHKMLRAFQGVANVHSAAVYSAIACAVCPSFLTTILTLLPQFGDNPKLAQCIADVLFDEAQTNVHPAEAFCSDEAVAFYICNHGKASFPEAYSARARETFQSDPSRTIPTVPPSGNTMKRRRADDLGRAMELMKRLEAIVESSDDAELKQAVRSRVDMVLRKS